MCNTDLIQYKYHPILSQSLVCEIFCIELYYRSLHYKAAVSSKRLITVWVPCLCESLHYRLVLRINTYM